MATKYCEFEPSQHRNKRVAQFVFLDDENDPHPLAICDVCTKKLKQMRPEAIVRGRKEHYAAKKGKEPATPESGTADSETPPTGGSSEEAPATPAGPENGA